MLRVLIIKQSAFGDIIHSLSVIRFFKEYSERTGREVELHWLIEEKWSPILKMCPGVHNIIVTDTKSWRRSPFRRKTRQELSRFLLSLRRERYDLVIDINGLIRSAILARIARSDRRIGFSRDSSFIRERHSAYLLDETFSVPPGHVVDQTIGLLERALNIKVSRIIFPYLPRDAGAAEAARRALDRMGLAPKKFAIIAAGGGWETKLLDEGSIARFCDLVDQYGVTPVLSWSGDAERDRAKKIAEHARCTVRELGDLPIDVFLEVLRMSRLVIGPDTGTVHAASAVKTGTVSYYGPSSADYSGPRRPSDRTVQISPPCGPCFKRRCDRRLCNNPDIRGVLDAIENQLDL